MQAILRFARGVLRKLTQAAARSATKFTRERQRRVNAGREFQIRAMSGFRLAGDCAGDQTPVHFREDDIHGEIGGAKAARVFPPLRFCRAGENRLQHRRIGVIENACFRHQAGPKSRLY